MVGWRGVSLFIMITRGDVQCVIDAFILEESLYWWFYPIERVQSVRGIGAWDGYHWTLVRQMAQDEEWVSLKAYIDTLGETYLRESMEHLVQSASPRLYHAYWPPKSVINWDAINGISEWEPKVSRVITDVYLDRGNDDTTIQ